MKTMTCLSLGGACKKEFSADTFEEIAEMSKKHAKEMFEAKDTPHIEAMNKMGKLMQSPEKMLAWFESKKEEFESL